MKYMGNWVCGIWKEGLYYEKQKITELKKLQQLQILFLFTFIWFVGSVFPISWAFRGLMDICMP